MEKKKAEEEKQRKEREELAMETDSLGSDSNQGLHGGMYRSFGVAHESLGRNYCDV